MNTDDVSYYSRLYSVWSVIAFGPSSRRLAELTEVYGSMESLYTAFREDETERSRLPAELVKAADRAMLTDAERVLEFCDKNNVGVISRGEEGYPERLDGIYAPPQVLFYRGDISGIDDRPAIAVVGTRKPSPYSLRIAAALVHTLAGNGFDIVSGFAEGIDICAHGECIRSGGRTYAVIGCGIDYPYPRNNMPYRGVIEENGAVITEFLPGTRPFPPNFPQRNRILAGLSLGVAVIEAGAKSGSINSAAHAESQNKPVFAVPPCDIFDKRYAGSAALIRDGAIPLMGARDILGEYGINSVHIIAANSKTRERLREIAEKTDAAAREQRELAALEKKKSGGRKGVSKKKKAAERSSEDTAVIPQPESAVTAVTAVSAEERLENISDPLQKRIVETLGGIPKRADELAEELETDIGDVLSALTELEIYGEITVFGGNYRLS